MVSQELNQRGPSARQGGTGLRSWLEAVSPLTERRAAAWVLALIVVTAGIHMILLLGSSPAPSVFNDELGYQKLAQSLGETGRLALFGKAGLSYSPLYPLLLAPLYAVHLSGPDAYRGALIVNCLLLALASFPIYRIALRALSPGRAVVAAAISALAPLTLFSSFVMSENLAYPLFLVAVWAMLARFHSPGVRSDALVLVLCFLCTAARLQFIVLVPAALAALLLVAIVAPLEGGRRRRDRLWRVLREHPLLAATNLVLALGGIAAYLGSRVIGVAGQYASQRQVPVPTPWHLADIVLQHLAGLDLTSGVIPFVGSLVAGVLWLRHRGRAPVDAFAAIAVCVAAAVLLITSLAAYGQSFPRGADLPRIHERYYFYLVPLLVIAMIATLGIPRSTALLKVGVAAAALGALLPTVIPYSSVINGTVGIDSFGLVMFTNAVKHKIEAMPHAMLLAVMLASCLGGLYALARPRPSIVLGSLAVLLVWMSYLERGSQVDAFRLAARVSFSAQRNWVDSVAGRAQVPLVEYPRVGLHKAGELETAFFNLSVARLYYPCGSVLYPTFNEQQVNLAPDGRLLDGGRPIEAAYAVVPAGVGIEGHVLASDRAAGLVLVRPDGGALRVSAARRAAWACPS